MPIASSCLRLPWTLSYPPHVVETWIRATVEQLAAAGFELVIVLTGHCPMDLLHLLKRACAEAAAPAHATSWLELNAARLRAPQTGEPRVVDHAAFVETSYMLALEPSLVQLERLSADPHAAHMGVYGPNPRSAASSAWGAASLDASAELLAGRADQMRGGATLDPFEDLRHFVTYAWPEPLEAWALDDAGAADDGMVIELSNPGRASRYISAFDPEPPLDPEAILLRNPSRGEVGETITAALLGPESGLYLRRGQSATIQLPRVGDLTIRVGLGGVAEQVLRITPRSA